MAMCIVRGLSALAALLWLGCGGSGDAGGASGGGDTGATDGFEEGGDGGGGDEGGDAIAAGPDAGGEIGGDGSGSPTAPPPGEICCGPVVAGSELACPLELVRGSEGAKPAIGLQFKLAWDGAAARFTGMRDELCFAGECYDVAVPPSALSPTGHSIVLSPLDPELWQGEVGVLVLLLSAAPPPITEAWLGSDGEIVGDARFVLAIFEVPAEAEPGGSLCLAVSGLAATGPDSEPQPVTVQGGRFVVSPPG
jgi:hypothetical protein